MWLKIVLVQFIRFYYRKASSEQFIYETYLLLQKSHFYFLDFLDFFLVNFFAVFCAVFYVVFCVVSLDVFFGVDDVFFFFACSSRISCHSGPDGLYQAGPLGRFLLIAVFFFGILEAVWDCRTFWRAWASVGKEAFLRIIHAWNRGSAEQSFLSLESWLNSAIWFCVSRSTSYLSRWFALSSSSATTAQKKNNEFSKLIIMSQIMSYYYENNELLMTKFK